MPSLTFVLLATLLGQAEGSVTDNLDLQVRQLVRQLDADKLATRDAAHHALIELGTDVLKHLPSAKDQTQAETKLRLVNIRKELEVLASRRAIESTQVTLQGKLKVSTILTEFLEQTGNKVIDYRNRFGGPINDPTITVDFRTVPFWQALDTVFDQSNLALYSYGSEKNAIVMVTREDGQLPAVGRVAYSGIFRIDPTQIRAVRDLRNPRNHALQLTLTITWEPRVVPLALEQPLNAIQLIAADGKPLKVDGTQGSLEVPIHRGMSAVDMVVPLVLPEQGGGRIVSFKGQLMVLISGHKATFTFDEIEKAQDVEKRQSGVTVVLRHLRQNASFHEVQVAVLVEESTEAIASHLGRINSNDAYLETPNGRRINHFSFETERNDMNEIILSYKFVLAEKPINYRFVYITPTRFTRRTVDYELKDILLP